MKLLANLPNLPGGTNFPFLKRRWLGLVVGLILIGMNSCGEVDSQQATDSNPAGKVETSGAKAPVSTPDSTSYWVFFGNSITAGYQLNPDQAFPALLQQRLDSLGYEQVEIVNAGVSGETSSGGLGRIDWLLQRPVDVFVLELGANDGLRGLPLTETEDNLSRILAKVDSAYPEATLVVAGMMIPPNMGPDYTRQFQAIFPRIAKAHDAMLIPFLLEGVAAEPELNLADGIHPNIEGHQIVANTVWRYLSPLLPPI